MIDDVMHEHLAELYRVYGRETVFISESEAAKYLRVDVRTVQRDKTFPSRTFGAKNKHRRVSLINFAYWLAHS